MDRASWMHIWMNLFTNYFGCSHVWSLPYCDWNMHCMYKIKLEVKVEAVCQSDSFLRHLERPWFFSACPCCTLYAGPMWFIYLAMLSVRGYESCCVCLAVGLAKRNKNSFTCFERIFTLWLFLTFCKSLNEFWRKISFFFLSLIMQERILQQSV